MSVIEDSRKILQDFVAPELRAIAARLDALEKQIDDVDRRAEKRAEEIDPRAEKRHDVVMLALGSLSNYNELRDRVVRLELKESSHR